MLTNGPGTFPLERLLALFQCTTSVLEEDFSLNERKNLRKWFWVDVRCVIATFCNAIQTSSVRVEIVPWRGQCGTGL
jgi:hypothetical protein